MTFPKYSALRPAIGRPHCVAALACKIVFKQCREYYVQYMVGFTRPTLVLYCKSHKHLERSRDVHMSYCADCGTGTFFLMGQR